MKQDMDVDAKNILGGVHSDSHDVHNVQTTYNTSNNSTVNNVYNIQRTQHEVESDNEKEFIRAVQELLQDGIFTPQKQAQLNNLSMQWQMPSQRAAEIVAAVRNNTKVFAGTKGSEFVAAQLVGEVYDAVQNNAVAVLQRKLQSLQQLAATSQDDSIQYFYYLLLASFSPEICVMQCLNSKVDNYWQLYWAFVANLKLKNTSNAEALLTRLGVFGYPAGDMTVLMALNNAYEYKATGQDYYKQQIVKQLEQAVQGGMSEQVAALWYALQDLANDAPCSEDWYRFYYEQTLKEFHLQKQMPVNTMCASKAMPNMPSAGMQSSLGMPSSDMPKMNAQKVKLNQMQGFNPLQQAKDMGLGTMSQQQMQMPSVPAMPQMQMPTMQMPSMPSMASMPTMQMPSMPTMPTMSGMPIMPTMPTAVSSATVEEEELGHEHLATEARQPEDDGDEPDPTTPLYGIIVTHAQVLADKYGCPLQEVYDVFNGFIQTAYDQEMYWSFLDLTNYQTALNTANVNAAISECIAQNSLRAGADLHVLLVGGADVIPLPSVEDPFECGNGAIHSDFLYCFEGDYLNQLIEGEKDLLDLSVVRNNVARLPLENGKLTTRIADDLGAYFNVSGMYAGGIPVGNVVMNANSDWIPASSTMTQHLPLLYNIEDPELIKNGMYISPKLLTCDDDAVRIYSDSLAKADMLLFNLHGCPAPNMPGFYSDDEAFSPDMLYKSNARVFNTVACFGARYAGYSREQSMLLTALYGGGILLYTGSLIPVPMLWQNEAQQMLLNPGSGSEIFMRLYALYQFNGLTAGQALLRAKCDYFNTCRNIEGDGFALSTAIMFCLYGNPMLHVRKKEHVIESALQNDAIPPLPVQAAPAPINKAVKQVVFDKNAPQGLLAEIRNKVDQNLAAIQSIVEKQLYEQLGLPPQCLESIATLTKSQQQSYLFHYNNKKAMYGAATYAEVDTAGNIKRIYKTK